MLGAIIGDICGSVYEWNNEKNVNKIELFKKGCFPTDDSVMTIAVAEALMEVAESIRNRKAKRGSTLLYWLISSPGL